MSTVNPSESGQPEVDIPQASSRPTAPSPGSRFMRIMREDVGTIQWRMVLANMALLFCPRGSLMRLRTAVYRACGVRIGRRSLLLGSIQLSGHGPVWKRLRIGEDCVVNSPLHVDANALIMIGNGVSIGHHVVLITTDHEIGPGSRRSGANTCKPIVIEDGCWIGASTTILPGVTVGRGSIVSAGSVVGASIPPNKLAAGVPARPIKALPED